MVVSECEGAVNVNPGQYQYEYVYGLTVELTEEEIEQVAQGGLTRLSVPEHSEYDYVEIEVVQENND